ncbi:STY0301 family protein [Undibacterium sp. TS12]|uniref:STY0301 family protein n=1 Tax=Undibacterium sp. TS12 TaxID=2908202 RepID=UPI001F4CE214|nr:STY0301 family protein [Undibacterium sp. TS12]MCH8622551.1 hypothetical protein [Undibacterium sp. TS12]
MKILLLFVTLFLGESGIVMAQICPATIKGFSQLKQDIPGWKVDSSDDTFNLGGMSIVEGPINQSAEGYERELVPLEKDGIQFWRFTKTVGRNELWMRCWYSGTSLRLSARIHSDVVECTRRNEPDQKTPRKQKIAAMCANTEHKNVKLFRLE